MKLFIVDSNKISKYKLTDLVEDSYTISYTNQYVKDVLISFVGKNNKWLIKSNGTVNVYEDTKELNEVEIEYYKCYRLKIIGNPELVDLYCLPTNETLFKMDFSSLQSFSVGSDATCNISYPSKDLASVQAIFKLVGNDWIVSSNSDSNYKIYINDTVVTLKKMKFGDVVFCGGLRFIWMNHFICCNNPENKLKVSGFTLIEDKNKTIGVELKEVSEEEKAKALYDTDDYFAPYPAIRDRIQDVEISITPPPSGFKNENLPWILGIGTTITMLSSSFAMAYNVGVGINNGQEMTRLLPQIVMCAATLLGGLLLPKITDAYQKKVNKRKEKERVEKYTEYLNKKTAEIERAISTEVKILNDTYINATDCLQALDKKNYNFWRWQTKDDEFLTIRLGNGRIKPHVYINAPESDFSLDSDELLEQVYKIKNRFEFVENCPITLSLRQYPIVSFINKKGNTEVFINEMLTQLLLLQNPNELKIAILTNERNAQRWDFMKYVPHIFSDDRNVRLFATNIEDAKAVSSYIDSIIKVRSQDEGENKTIYTPHYLIITDCFEQYKNVPVLSELSEDKNNCVGVSLIALSKSIKNVPLSSSAFIDYNDTSGVIIDNSAGICNQILFKIANNPDPIDMRRISLLLADTPIISGEEISSLPTSLSFLDMFGVSKVEQLNITDRWRRNNPVQSLDTVVGVHKNGDKFSLDLHEKFHGPHGLIAGSTGSGKSEFIITYILSLAINYHPYEVQFVLIDYKGGGLAGAFENNETGVRIPHLVGTITNLDVSEMNRSLISIQSELRRRQRIFNEVRESLNEGTIDIYKYQKLYRDGVVKKPLAHLFIICDEFAELKQQRPEFMEQLISASRIGRSLGIHLILATQKPSGVVNDQIWANSKFKVCLKVQDKSDSMEMLKRPEAADIKEAGRFFLQVGYNDYFDIGQSGWSGAKYIPSDRILAKVDESINYIDNVGYSIKSVKDVGDKSKTITVDYGDQLTNIVKYIYDLGNRDNIVTNQLWLESIPAVIFDSDLRTKYEYKPEPYNITPLIGELDDPVNQSKYLFNIDLTNKGNLLIYGNPGSGKEFLLTNLIHSIVVEHNPDEVNLYILDCGSESLKIFNNYPHVGDVLTVDEDEKILDMLNMAALEIERRKELFRDYAGSYVDYIQNSGQKLPLQVYIINNYDNFMEQHDKKVDMLNSIVRDGARYGVVFIITVVAVSIIRNRFSQLFENKICLQLSDDLDYRTILGAPRGAFLPNIYGRGLVNLDGECYEFQTATFADRKDYSNVLRDLAKTLNSAYTTRAVRVPSIPNEVLVEPLLEHIKDGTNIPIGYNIADKFINYFDFNGKGIVPIVSMDIDATKISFVFSLIQLLNLNLNSSVQVVDFANAYYTKIDGIVAIKDNYDAYFINMANEIRNNNDDIERFYFILGASYLKSKLKPEIYAIVSELFNSISNYPHVHVIIVDVYNGIKQIMIDSWYQSLLEEKTGIWLGDGIGSQMAFNIKNMDSSDKLLSFPNMAFVINGGKYQIIKHVIKKENEDEE